MLCYALCSKGRSIDALAGWLLRDFLQIGGSICGDVRPECEGPIELPVIQRPKEPYSAIGHRSFSILREDFAEVLKPHLSAYRLGAVLYNGEPVDGFYSVFATSDARVPKIGDNYAYGRCPECGRIVKKVLYGMNWFASGDVNGRQVFTDVRGVQLYVTRPVYQSVPRQLRRQMDVYQLEIRTAPPTDLQLDSAPDRNRRHSDTGSAPP